MQVNTGRSVDEVYSDIQALIQQLKAPENSPTTSNSGTTTAPNGEPA